MLDPGDDRQRLMVIAVNPGADAPLRRLPEEGLGCVQGLRL
jgi:hypothetical protein